MPDTVVAVGEKLHIITRRNFAEDLRRHYAGTVQSVDGDLVRLRGYTFVFNAVMNEYRRRPEIRTRIFSLGDAQLIINVIPEDTHMEDLAYRKIDDRLVITDSKSFRLDVNEFGAND